MSSGILGDGSDEHVMWQAIRNLLARVHGEARPNVSMRCILYPHAHLVAAALKAEGLE